MQSSKQLALALVTWAIALPCLGAQLGVIGPTYRIAEPDMLEWIENKARAKVESGEALKYMQERTAAIKEKLTNPVALTTVSKALTNKTSYYDPTFQVEENVLDEKGAIVVPAGTTINPLDRVGLSRTLIFFDARDASQVAFAKKYIDKVAGLTQPILVGGSYFDLMKAWNTPVYFDQQGSLVRRFAIKHVPAIVRQEGKRLRIDEIAL